MFRGKGMVAALVAASFAGPVMATDLRSTDAVATLNALDKITGRVSQLKAHVGKPVRFGAIEVTLRSCQSAPPEEAPETKAFLEIRDLKPKADAKTVFSGWMFASSPALNALEHPVYDVWVISCSAIAPSISSLPPAADPVEPESPAAGEPTEAPMPEAEPVPDSGAAENVPSD